MFFFFFQAKQCNVFLRHKCRCSKSWPVLLWQRIGIAWWMYKPNHLSRLRQFYLRVWGQLDRRNSNNFGVKFAYDENCTQIQTKIENILPILPSAEYGLSCRPNTFLQDTNTVTTVGCVVGVRVRKRNKLYFTLSNVKCFNK